MLDPALFREDVSEVAARLAQRGSGLDDLVHSLQTLDAERRRVIPVLEEARRAKTHLGGQIGKAKRAGVPAEALLAASQDNPPSRMMILD